MSVLALLLPPRERLGARSTDTPGAARVPAEWGFVFSTDGRAATQAGSVATGLLASLPRADQVVLVLADADVSWHRVAVPKAPAARLRAALVGVMEDTLLDDDEALHFALGADAVPGRSGWVAVTHRPRLAAALAALEEAGLAVEKVVAGQAPLADGATARGHFFGGTADDDAAAGAGAAPWLTLARAEGVITVRTTGALARALLPDPAADGVRWTASASAAAAAERWLGAPVALLSDAERALEAAQAPHNLRQFDLVARHRGSRALREGAKRLLSREWRPVRWGVAALFAVQLVGLNAHAWQQRQALDAKREAMAGLLRSAHPGVRAVLDPALQMQRETERLRSAAGRPGEGDFESLLGMVAAAWPDGQGPLQTLRFEPGRLSFTAPGFGEPQLAQLRERLRPAGYAAESAEGRVTVSRVATPAGAPR
jgi:general secretion pathway protein L